jgi:hypothetical protein
MRANSAPTRPTWLAEACGASHANRCGVPVKLAAAIPTEAPSSSSRRASEATATHRLSNAASSHVISQWGPGSVCTSSAITTSRPRAGSYRRLTGFPSRALARQWTRRSESPG